MKLLSLENLPRLLLFGVVLLGALVACAGCPRTNAPTPLPPQISQKTADGIGAGVKQGATDVTTSAKAIQKSAQAGKAATPPADLSALAPYWDAILSEVSNLFATGGKLDTVAADVATLKEQMKLEHDAAAKSIAEERARAASLQKQLDDAKSSDAKLFRNLKLVAVVLCAGGVALMLFMPGFHYSVMVIGFGGALFLFAIVAGVVEEHRLLIGGTVIACGIIFGIFEWWRNGDFKSAIFHPAQIAKKEIAAKVDELHEVVADLQSKMPAA